MDLNKLVRKEFIDTIAQCDMCESKCKNPLCGKTISYDVYYMRGTEDANLTWMYCSSKCAKKGFLFQEGFKHGINAAYDSIESLQRDHRSIDTKLPMPEIE